MAAPVVQFLSFEDERSIAMTARFPESVSAVVDLIELSSSSELRLREVLGLPPRTDVSDQEVQLWLGYPDKEAAVAAIDDWHGRGVISDGDTLDLCLRDNAGRFVFVDQY